MKIRFLEINLLHKVSQAPSSKTPAFWGIFFPKFSEKKKSLFRGCNPNLFFLILAKISHLKKWTLRSQEKCFLKEFFWCSLNGAWSWYEDVHPKKKMTTYHSEEDLAKSGYKLNMKYKIFCQPFLFMATNWKPNSKICQFLLFIF